jgi:hypothetical protein
MDTMEFAQVFLGCILTLTTLSADIKEEFPICEEWRDGITWKEFLVVRNGLKRPELVKYVDKIQQQEIARELGLQVPETYIATHERVPVVELLATLPSFVAKMTHLSYSEGLIIVNTTPIWGRYDRNGNMVDGPEPAPEWWEKAVAAAELVSKDTDALRVDFLVREDGTLLLNELEIWSESNWSSMRYTLESQLNAGYREFCQIHNRL